MTKPVYNLYVNHNHQLNDLHVTMLELGNWTDQESKRQELHYISQYLTMLN